MELVTVNSILCGLVVLVAVGSVAAMNKTTCNAVRFAILFIIAGGAGQVLGHAAGVWQEWLDTLLFGGMLALLVANVRTPKGVAIRWSPRLAIAAMISTLAVLAAYSLH